MSLRRLNTDSRWPVIILFALAAIGLAWWAIANRVPARLAGCSGITEEATIVGYFAALLTENEPCYFDLLDRNRYNQVGRLISSQKAEYSFSLDMERESLDRLFKATESALSFISIEKKDDKLFEVRIRLTLRETFQKNKFDYAKYTIDSIFIVQLTREGIGKYKIAEVREMFSDDTSNKGSRVSMGFAKCYFSDCYEMASGPLETATVGKVEIRRVVDKFVEHGTKAFLFSRHWEQRLSDDGISSVSSILLDGSGNRIVNYHSFER